MLAWCAAHGGVTGNQTAKKKKNPSKINSEKKPKEARIVLNGQKLNAHMGVNLHCRRKTFLNGQ